MIILWEVKEIPDRTGSLGVSQGEKLLSKATVSH